MRLKSNDFNSSFDSRSRYYDALIGDGTYYGTEDQNVALLEWMKTHGYKSGVRSASNGLAAYDENGLGSEMIITKEGILKSFNAGDTVFNENKKDTLWDFTDNPVKFITDIASSKLPVYTTNNSSSGFTVGTLNTNLSFPNVKNYEDFINQAKSDSRFEKLVQSVSLGNSLGNNRLSKYNI